MEGFCFALPPPPSPLPKEFQFTFKVWLLKPLPLGISDALPWGRYGFFLEPTPQGSQVYQLSIPYVPS